MSEHLTGEFREDDYERVAVVDFSEDIEKIKNKIAFSFIIRNFDPWPGQDLFFQFEFSNPANRWLFRIANTTEGELVRGPAILNRPYDYRDIVRFRFVDPSNESARVDHRTLGEKVVLECYPGTRSEAYPFDDN
jgi:hypothetical protein